MTEWLPALEKLEEFLLTGNFLSSSVSKGGSQRPRQCWDTFHVLSEMLKKCFILFHMGEISDNEALIWPLGGEDERLEEQNDCQMYIDLSSFVVPVPATHNGWSDVCDAGLAIDERIQRVRREFSWKWQNNQAHV